MKNKLLTQLLIFSLLFLTWWSIEDLKPPMPVSSKISSLIPIFPSVQIDFLLSENTSYVEEALDQTAKTLIQYISPELSDESWQSQCIFLDLLGDRDQELVVSLTLSPDRGYLALVNKQNGQYTLYYYLDNLLPLGKIDRLNLPGNKDILVTREDHNERMGAYTETKTLKLWTWQDNTLRQLWSENSFWEMNWINTWENPNANPRIWSKLVQDLTVSYEVTPVTTVKIEGEQFYYKSPASEYETLPPPYKFQEQTKRSIEASFRWNEEWQRFVLNTGLLTLPDSNPQRIAILKDMEAQLEAMVIAEQRVFYQVINEDGQIFLANKQYVKLD
ncbi:MAG: hypothetical protein CVU87_00250 [Firmicutes bacterium HGW-Firmicutes-12]|nr:MAG: hypothetical protein CVU87_00250 [Firmicutes bacterium HGW-Firmicutes-12]